MATSSYCSRHDINYRGSECPRCLADNRHEEILRQQREASEQQRDLLSDASYRQFNPGQYQCPHCLFQSLKRNASRCPLCHGVIDGEYWVQIQKSEKEAEVRRAEMQEKERRELERTRPERERLAREQEQKNARDARLENFNKVISQFFLGIFIILVPYLVVRSAHVLIDFGIPQEVMLIPFVNWLILLAGMIFGHNDGLLFEFTILCGVGVAVSLLLVLFCLRQAVKSMK